MTSVNELVLQPVDETEIRAHALNRVRGQLRDAELAAVLLCDPPNVRYVSGDGLAPCGCCTTPTASSSSQSTAIRSSGNMGRTLRRSTRRPPLALRCGSPRPGGCSEMVSFPARALSGSPPKSPAFYASGDCPASLWGIDHLDGAGYAALHAAGLDLRDAQQPLELARCVKCDAEIAAIRNSIAVCDAALTDLRTALSPGMTEYEAWALFLGGALRRGADTLNAAYSPRGRGPTPGGARRATGDFRRAIFLALDTDLIGPLGYLADISRTYLCGQAPPTEDQSELYGVAYGFIEDVIPHLHPGASFADLGELGRLMPEPYRELTYPFIAHGSGMGDEYPAVKFTDHHPGALEANMVLSVEAYVGRVGGHEGVKLEEPVLVTDDGAVKLSAAPHDDRLLA